MIWLCDNIIINSYIILNYNIIVANEKKQNGIIIIIN